MGNELTNWNGTTIGPDANGNILNDGVAAYTWNGRNQLISRGSTSFQYDSYGRRTLNAAGNNLLYDGWNAGQELSGTTPVANRILGGIDEFFSRTDSTRASGPITDALGSVLALANSSGNITTQYSYDPFGNTTGNGGTSTNVFQYTGRENDGNGLYFYRGRYYSPSLQRFMSEDPLGSSGQNLYSYVSNDPVDAVDPWGLYAYCYFNQVAGGIVCYGLDGSTMSDPAAYSGYGPGTNNPSWVTWGEIGPIPEGDYWIGPGYDGKLGKPQFPLTPVKDPFMHIPNMTGRDPNSFLMHADSQSHPGMASIGCIITSRDLRRWLAKQGGGVTEVYNPKNNPFERRIALTTP